MPTPSKPKFAANPYAASGGGKKGGGSLPSGRSAWQYAVPGAIFDIVGALTLIGVVLQIAMALYMLTTEQGQANAVSMLLNLLGVFAIGTPVGIAYLLGGSAMIRRGNRSAARTAAVISCIPCFNCVGLLTPIGIWACVMMFSAKAEQDFSD